MCNKHNTERNCCSSELTIFINQESTENSLKSALVSALVFRVNESTSSCSRGASRSSVTLTAKGVGTAGWYSDGSLGSRREETARITVNESAKALVLESWVTCLISCETLGKNWRKFLKKQHCCHHKKLTGCGNNRCTHKQGCFFFFWIWVLQSYLLCKGNGFWNLFTFLSVDGRSWQIPPKSQEATGLCSEGLLGSTGKADYSQENCFHYVFPMLSL